MCFTHDSFQEGDIVEIIGGRKIKKGTLLEVDRCAVYRTDIWCEFYVIFKNGQKTAYRNCRLIKRRTEI